MQTKETATCTCFIVPKYVKEALAKLGLITEEVVKASIAEDEKMREDRKQKIRSLIGEVKTSGTPANSSRTVYDCGNKTALSHTHTHILRKEGDAPVADQDANEAYDFGGTVRDYYKQMLNRNSIDNKGLNLDFFVHRGKNYDNAFWDGKEMVFGDGDGKMFGHFTKGLDVIGHELTHGVVQYTAALDSSEFASCLNEHIADVFGTVIKQWYNKQNAQTADWLIGDKVVLPAFPGKALRSMKAPGTAFTGDTQPSNMKNYLPWGGDPHLNNGIPNHAFYLVSAGDKDVKGLDTTHAGLLWYEALNIMKPDSNFKDLYTAVHKSALKLITNGKLPAGADKVVDHAFKTVGII